MNDPPPPYSSLSYDLKYGQAALAQSLLPGGVPQPSAPPPCAANLPPSSALTQQGEPTCKLMYALPLGPYPTNIQCANCLAHDRTRCVPRPGLLTWLICGGLALIGFWPCCCIPFCVKSCHDVEHYCAQCGTFIGKYSRI